jgi:hypothetical protein
MMRTHVATRRFDRRMGGIETGEGDPVGAENPNWIADQDFWVSI